MYDVAGAPGMFVLAADFFFRKRNIDLDWHACSLINTEENHALEDNYNLFKDNPDITMFDLNKQNELHHAKTLAQIFFENRIYKKIEECRSQEEEYREVHSGLAPFRYLLQRDISNEDIDKLLALPVRRIARFDIEKNQQGHW